MHGLYTMDITLDIVLKLRQSFSDFAVMSVCACFQLDVLCHRGLTVLASCRDSNDYEEQAHNASLLCRRIASAHPSLLLRWVAADFALNVDPGWTPQYIIRLSTVRSLSFESAVTPHSDEFKAVFVARLHVLQTSRLEQENRCLASILLSVHAKKASKLSIEFH